MRLSAESASGTTLRWAVRAGASYRLYRAGPVDRHSFCVSTRSTEVVAVLDGEMRIELGPKRQEVVVRRGEVVVVARGTPHRYWVRAGSETVVFDVEAGRAALPPVALSAGGEARRLVAVADRLAHADLAVHVPDVAQVAVDASTRLERSLAVEHVQSTRLMNRVREVLERWHTEAVSLESTARSHGVDPFYLSRAFKRNFGVPPQSYVQFLRTEHFVWESLRAAARAPELGRVAGDAGFGDYSTFSRRMRALFGKPPSELFERF